MTEQQSSGALEKTRPSRLLPGIVIGSGPLLFHPDGEHILTGSYDTTAKLWRIGADAPVQTFAGHRVSVLAVAFHPDGEHILTGSGDTTAKLWRIDGFVLRPAAQQIADACTILTRTKTRAFTNDQKDRFRFLRGQPDDPCAWLGVSPPLQPKEPGLDTADILGADDTLRRALTEPGQTR